MPNFVKEINDICKELNKFVHKTGFDNFYDIRKNYGAEFHKRQLKDFEDNLISSIRIVAIMRLVMIHFHYFWQMKKYITESKHFNLSI